MFGNKKTSLPPRPKPPDVEEILEDLLFSTDKNDATFRILAQESGYHETSTLAENSELNSMYEKVKTYLDVNERLRGASASLCQSDEQLQSSVQSVMKLTEEIKIQAQAALKQ